LYREENMKIQHYRDVKPEEPVQGAKMHVVAGPEEGAPNFIMRIFEIEPGSNTPFHEHDWEHEIFIIDGPAGVRSSESTTPLKPGTAIFIPSGEKHGIVNLGQETVKLVCVIPNIKK
jgi:quercetin dioxygenase-like cupin family protein